MRCLHLKPRLLMDESRSVGTSDWTQADEVIRLVPPDWSCRKAMKVVHQSSTISDLIVESLRSYVHFMADRARSLPASGHAPRRCAQNQASVREQVHGGKSMLDLSGLRSGE